MDKISNFRKLIKNNRYILEGHGINRATVNSWIYTDRVPEYETACLISDILQILLTDIPYYRRGRVI